VNNDKPNSHLHLLPPNGSNARVVSAINKQSTVFTTSYWRLIGFHISVLSSLGEYCNVFSLKELVLPFLLVKKWHGKEECI
jgi:hypothetical protein